jgi:hypothetical protein
MSNNEPIHHAFICHALEDKEIARKIANGLIKRGAHVWFDEYVLRVGDSIRQKIDDGLRKSRFGVVLISKVFFDKGWANYELDGLLQKHMVLSARGGRVVLPVWVDVNYQQVMDRAPSLAGIYAARLDDGIEKVIQDLLWAMRDPVIDLYILTPAQQSDLENAARQYVRRNAREGLQFELVDFRYVHEPRGGWWATCSAPIEKGDSALVLMYMSPEGYWGGINMGTGIELSDYPLPGPLMPRWW